jgi:AcrR family transcriptional regulator
MAKRTKADAEKTRTRILASALSLFVKRGYERTTFTDIASRLKMTKGAVYWHFESKEKLLLALVDEMVAKFRRQICDMLPEDGDDGLESLTFADVVDTMVRNATLLIGDAKGTAFFLLVHEQIRWSDASMDKVREELLVNKRFGPWAAFKKAVENDIRDGRARSGVDAVKVASVAVAIWDGLVHSRIAGILQCDLEETLREAFDAVRRSIEA